MDVPKWLPDLITDMSTRGNIHLSISGSVYRHGPDGKLVVPIKSTDYMFGDKLVKFGLQELEDIAFMRAGGLPWESMADDLCHKIWADEFGAFYNQVLSIESINVTREQAIMMVSKWYQRNFPENRYSMTKVNSYREFLSESNQNIRDIDWGGIERQMADSKDKFDCIPTNAREWSLVKGQYQRLQSLRKAITSGELPNGLTIPKFAEEYVMGDDPYKRSIIEIFKDEPLLASSLFGDIYVELSACIQLYVDLQHIPVFGIHQSHLDLRYPKYIINVARFASNVKTFNSKSSEELLKEIIGDAKHIKSKPKPPHMDAALMVWMGTKIFTNTEWWPSHEGVLSIDSLPDVINLENSNAYVRAYLDRNVKDLKFDELRKKFSELSISAYKKVYQ